MKKTYLAFFFSFTILIQSAIAVAGQLPSSLEQYRETVQRSLAEEKNDSVSEYLRSCLAAADHLNGLEASDSRVPSALSVLVQQHLGAADKLTSQTSGSPGVRAEQNAYNTHLQPYLKAQYINLIALQDQLLERKYFKTETAKNANFLEGIANSYLSFTHTDHSDIRNVLAQPHLGVSPWEAIFRIEPAIAIEHGVQPAFLGTAGMSYAFFPDIDRSTANAVMHETFWSKWVQKSGGRIGIGAGNMDNHVRLLIGTGVQINAVGLWGLYRPDSGAFLFGMSASDLSKFKKVIGWFD